MKWYTLSATNFLLSLSVIFLPKAVLFPIIRVYSNIRFYFLNKNHEAKKDKQKHNLFANKPTATTSKFRFDENRIANSKRQIDRSLRSVVKMNRKQMKPAITDEEKGLQILAKGQ